jgi:hypothetical protein
MTMDVQSKKQTVRMLLGLTVTLCAIFLFATIDSNPLHRTDTFYITPQIRHLDLTSPKSKARLEALFADLEPAGAAGKVQLGFTLTFPLYVYFDPTADDWKFNEKNTKRILEEAATLKRPFNIYIAADHFFGYPPFGKHLAENPRSLMQFQDGSVPSEKYFTESIVPYRISNDEHLPHIKAKFDALRIIAKQLVEFRKEHPNLLIGVTLNGETHYMFEDFFNGTGNFTTPRYTDFSDGAIKEFQAYLDAKHYTDAPASTVKKLDFTQSPWGSYPFFGWYCATSPKEKVVIYHNGERMGDAQMHVNRMDVYNTVPKLHNPNCGWRYDIDFSTWKAGTHRLEAVVEFSGRNYAIGNNQLLLQLGDTPTALPNAQTLPSIAMLDRQGFADRGSMTPMKVSYHPIAREWIAFRAQSIVEHQDMMGQILVDGGLPKDIIYNYQLPPWMNGDWNEALFGVGQDFFMKSKFRAGVTLYGGNTLNDGLFDYIPKNQPYSVPEFHPQMENDNAIAEQALLYHANHGASFVSPYFLNVGDNVRDGTEHYFMMIDPTNTHKSSDALYRAIKNLSAY